MDNVVDLFVQMDLRHPDKATHGDTAPFEDNDEAEDRFLIDEGLDLLAAYRAIENHGVRHAIRTLVEALAKAEQVAGKASG